MLTDTAVRKAKPGDKARRLFDERGLYLEVSPAGGKWWRFKYRFDGKEKRISLGVYPDVSLKDARARCSENRTFVASGVDPSVYRKAQKVARKEKVANSFEVVAREWFEKQSTQWAPSHAHKTIRRLERDVFPWIGSRPVADIRPPELLKILRRIEGRGALETAHRALQNVGQVFRYAIATGRAEQDPSRDLRGALTPWKPQHFAAITDPKEVGALLRAMGAVNAGPVVKAALQLTPLLFVRPGELRRAEWSEIDFEVAQWNVPAEKMKARQPHVVPLAPQALEILRELHHLTGVGRYVFPGRSPRTPMSENAVRLALRRMGYTKEQVSAHGFRAMARTILDEVLHVRPDFVEHQLAHAVRDANGRAYNRTAHLKERHRMMRQWADYLDQLREGATVVNLRTGQIA